MTNGSDAVRQHYAMSGILDRVTAFLLERGIDPERPTYQDFFPFDQLHARGVEATREAYRARWYQFEHAGNGPGVRSWRSLACHCRDMRLPRHWH